MRVPTFRHTCNNVATNYCIRIFVPLYLILLLTHLRLAYIVLLFLLSFLGATAQPICHLKIKGIVLDGETNQPFEGVSVFLKEFNVGTVSDAKGRFELSKLCEGEHEVVYSFLGYKTYVAKYKLTEETVYDRVLLHTDTCVLESVTIYGIKAENQATYTTAVLDGKSLEKTRGLSLADALKELPGVEVYRTGTSIAKPVIHGMYGNRVLMLNAGLRQEGQQWGNEHAPEIDPFVSDKLAVIKGASVVRYGSDAIAGVVVVEPRKMPLERGVFGEMNLVGMGNNRQGTASAILEGKLGEKIPLQWRFQGTYKKAGNAKTPQYYLANTGFEEKNFSYSLAYNKKWFESNLFYSQFNTTLGIFSGAHIGSLADLQTAINRTRPAVTSHFSYDIQRPFQHVEHELVRLKLAAKIYALGKVGLQLGRQFNDRSEFDLLRSSQANLRKDNPQLQFKLTTHSVDAYFEHKPVAKLNGSFGVAYIRQSNVWQGRFLIPNFISNAYGIFATEKWVHRKFEAELGIRYDQKNIDVYTNGNGLVQKTPHFFSQTVATIALAYMLRENLTLRADFGTTWRPPTVNELYSKGLHHGAAAIENGNPTIRPEKAYKAVVSLENRGEKYKSSLVFYYNHIQDYIYLKPDLLLVQTTRGAFPSFTYSQINARFFGTDAMTDFQLTKAFQLIWKGAVVLARNETENQYVPFVPPFRYSGTLRYSPHFNQFLKKHQAYVGVSCARVEKQHRVPENADYMPPPPAYTLFGAEMGADIVFGKYTVVCSLEINNLFDVSYRDYMNRFRYFNDEMGRNVVFRMKMPLTFRY